MKLVAEPGRIWLALEHDERPATREDALRLLLRRLPEEEAALRATIELQRTLHRSPEPRWPRSLPVLLRLSERIAAALAAQLADAPVTEVALTGAAGALPLADWRALVAPPAADERLVPMTGDPADPAVLGAAVLAHPTGPYPVMRSGQLLLLPGGEFVRTRMRSIQCRLTDPVSFALLDGDAHGVASPTSRAGRSTTSARRAVAEHAARLRSEPGDLELLLDRDAGGAAARQRAPRRARARAHGRRRASRGCPATRPPRRSTARRRLALREQVLALPAYASARHLSRRPRAGRDHLELARVGERERVVERRPLAVSRSSAASTSSAVTGPRGSASATARPNSQTRAESPGWSPKIG